VDKAESRKQYVRNNESQRGCRLLSTVAEVNTLVPGRVGGMSEYIIRCRL